MATIEAKHYRQEVRDLAANEIVQSMALGLRGVETISLAHEDGTPRFDFMMKANAEFARRGGKGASSIGGVARALLALLPRKAAK